MTATERQLAVCLNGQAVGRLAVDAAHRYRFSYDAAAIRDPAGSRPLSVSLPVREAPYGHAETRAYFGNLLPEGPIRQALCQVLGLSVGNDFDLLAAIGGECAGAVAVGAPAGAESEAESEYRGLTEDELHGLLTVLPRRPLLVDVDSVRQCLAGSRPKIPVRIQENQVYAPLGHCASTHILKPATAALPDAPDNEAFCMNLAERTGLRVPKSWVREGVDRVFAVARFDRDVAADGSITAIHQEDFCQALGVVNETKYEREGGPDLGACFDLLRRRSCRPAADVRMLLRWVIFNYLIGNSDAHAKKLALEHTQQGPRLAPFYDLLSTRVYPDLNRNLAMRIGAEERPDWVIVSRWRELAQRCGVKFKYVAATMEEMAGDLHQRADALAEDFQSSYGYSAVIGRILEIISHRSRKTVVALALEKI